MANLEAATKDRRSAAPANLLDRKPAALHVDAHHALLRAIGNRGLQRLLGTARDGGASVGGERATTEEEADRVAGSAESGSSVMGALERQSGRGATPDVALGATSGAGAGQPLPEQVQAYFAPRFGRDLSDVRVHTDGASAAAARAAGATAYTIGARIFFAEGAYAPETASGRRLLAHELTHVVQQTGGGRAAVAGLGRGVSAAPVGMARQPAPANPNAKLEADLQATIDGAVWPEVRKRVYPKESAAGIKRAKERKLGTRTDLTGLGKITTLEHFATAIKGLQGRWAALGNQKARVDGVGKAINAELKTANVPELTDVVPVKMTWKGDFSPRSWVFHLNEDLVKQNSLGDPDAAELANTGLHEARHAEQHFLAARFAAGPPKKQTAAQIATEQKIPEDPIAKAAVAAKFDASTPPAVAKLGADMYQSAVTDRDKNANITNDDYTKEMKDARDKAIAALAALRASPSAVTVREAVANKSALEAAIQEVERRYTLYRNIPHEADAHEVGDAEEQAFKGWP